MEGGMDVIEVLGGAEAPNGVLRDERDELTEGGMIDTQVRVQRDASTEAVTEVEALGKKDVQATQVANKVQGAKIDTLGGASGKGATSDLREGRGVGEGQDVTERSLRRLME